MSSPVSIAGSHHNIIRYPLQWRCERSNAGGLSYRRPGDQARVREAGVHPTDRSGATQGVGPQRQLTREARFTTSAGRDASFSPVAGGRPNFSHRAGGFQIWCPPAGCRPAQGNGVTRNRPPTPFERLLGPFTLH